MWGGMLPLLGLSHGGYLMSKATARSRGRTATAGELTGRALTWRRKARRQSVDRRRFHSRWLLAPARNLRRVSVRRLLARRTERRPRGILDPSRQPPAVEPICTVTLNNVHIEGHSPVHAIASDCEMHFGAHATTFQGSPDGLVLEPMNVCVQPFPGQSEQSNSDWTTFGNGLLNSTVSATGVPRIWPEHLNGGTASNPDHAVELHPLASITSSGATTDFTDVFAGAYRGGVGQTTAFQFWIP